MSYIVPEHLQRIGYHLPTLCFFDTTANPWCSLNELHEALRQSYLVEFLALLTRLGLSVVLCRCHAVTHLTALLVNF